MKARWKIIAAFVVFGCVCIAAGIVIGRESKRREYRRRNNPAQLRETWNQGAMRTLQSELRLTEPQVAQLHAIMDRGVEDLIAIREDTKTRANAVLDRMVAELEPHLTPEQRAALTKLKDERARNSIDMLYVEPRK